MGGDGSWLLIVLLMGAVGAAEDWSNCPSVCRCKWASGKKVAECKNGGLSAIPGGLSPEIQAIDLSENTLHSIPKEAFRSVALINLHKIFLKECGITELHKDAFRGLEILIELDLSHNRIHVVHPGTFRDNLRLRVLLMNNNPIQKLEDGLFTNLTFLQTVDMSDCQLSHISHKTFINVPTLQHLHLNGNNLVHMKVSVIEHLERLISLVLDHNPWRCDCHLRAFRDLTIERNLYVQPTSCAEPPKLQGKSWTDVPSDEFACKPQIIWPPLGTSIEAEGDEVTLTCRVTGNPMPEVRWVVNTRVITNNTRMGYNDLRYSVRGDRNGWMNLTIIRVKPQDRGEFTCIAESQGGIDERNVTLIVRHYQTGGMFPRNPNDYWPLIMGLASGLIAVLLLALILCCCLCKRRSNEHPRPKKVPDNGQISHQIPANDQEKSLLTVVNPVQKPPRRYEPPPTQLSELNRNLLDDTGGSTVGDGEERSTASVEGSPQHIRSREGLEDGGVGPPYPPDLLAFPRASPSPVSPLHSPNSFMATLPYSRSHSPRHGYVTIPRRPRVPSWSSAPTPTLLEDPLSPKAEPVYDNLGPRTTADGSSVLSLNKGLPLDNTPRSRSSHCHTLPTPRKTSLPPHFTHLDAPRLNRTAPEGASIVKRSGSVEGMSSLQRPKVPPKPPPKPKKNGPLYEDEGEDGTEV